MSQQPVSSEWIDIHAHLSGFSARGGIDPDRYGYDQSVGVIVDAGSAPPAELPRLLDASAGLKTHVLAWANICAEGIAGQDCSTHDISGAGTDEALAQCPGRVVGIKLQASNTRLAGRALEAIKNARAIAERRGVPLMVHVGNAPPTMREVLPLLRAGDVVTHFAHGKPGGALEDGRVDPSLIKARARRVLFDIGHGSGSFSFEVMEQLLAQDFPPDIISTDLHAGSAESPVGSLADCMSKLLGLGMPLNRVMRAVTSNPAMVFGLKPATRNTRFECSKSSPWVATDSYGQQRTFTERIMPLGIEEHR